MKVNLKKNIAIILARKNSKRIKNKNLVRIASIPLIEHSIKAAKDSKLIDRYLRFFGLQRCKKNM